MDNQRCNIPIDENIINSNTISNFCRLCLDNKLSMKSLYSPLEEIYEEGITTLFHIMQKLSRLKLSNDPKYPSYICLNCISLLNTAYKVNRLMEISQTQIKTYFMEQTNSTNCKIDYINIDSVEIISNQGKYNLKDILVVEDNDKEKSNFDGFLKNLGSEITAEFVAKSTKKELKKDELHIVNLIPIKEAVNNMNNIFQDIELKGDINLSETGYKQSRIVQTKVVENRRINTTQAKLQRQKRTRYANCRPHLCQICGHITNGANSLNNHMMLKHFGKRYPCEVCGKKYLSNSHLRQHMLKHKNERSYLCTVCGKNFNYGSSLEYHMRIHTGERKYKCTYCDANFTMMCSLNRHLRTHTGIRPYKCKFCEKAFRSKGEVDCHEMVHTGFRPYHCELCGKGFTKTHNMKIHMLGHTGPFLCEFCPRGFTSVFYLKLHMKVTHGLSDYDLDKEHIIIVQENDIEFGQLEETLITTE